MIKDLNYYMTLPYTIKVEELSEDDGGGVFLSIPLLGEMAVCAHGETYPEARSHLELVKKDYFEMWIEDGVEIPEPQRKNLLDDSKIYVRELEAVGV